MITVVTRGASGTALRRGAASELRRLGGDPLLWAVVPLALLSAVSLIASLPSAVRSAPEAAVDALSATLGESLLGGFLLIGAVLGALGVALSDRAGVLAREHLFTSSAVLFGARSVSAAMSAAAFGTVSIAVVQITFAAFAGRALFSWQTAASAVAATAAAGLWGYLIGLLVRSPVLVLFVVPVTLSPALFLGDVAPELARLLPFRALRAATGVSAADLDQPIGAAVVLAWLAILAGAAITVLRRRDRL